jgi:hypothetical protein
MGGKSGLFAFDASRDVRAVVADARDWGIDELILHPGYFGDGRTEEALAAAGLGLWLNLPVFYNPEHLAARPEDYAIASTGERAIHDWSHFVCPTAPGYVEALEETFAALAARLKPARISLDFIRTFVFWETVALDGDPATIVDGCYCPRCLAAFKADTSLALPVGGGVAALRGPLRAAWGAWKTARITAVAGRLIAAVRAASPDSRILIKTIPWRETDLDGAIRVVAGQDVAALGRLADVSVPMAFAPMLKRDLAWKEALMADVRARTGKPTAPYVQAAALFDDPPIAPETVAEEVRRAKTGGSECMAVFCHDLLTGLPEVVRALRAALVSP